MKRTGWMLGILAALALLVGAARAAEQPGAAGADAKEETIRALAAKTFSGVKDALVTGNETLAREILERALRSTWDKAQATRPGEPGPTEKSDTDRAEEMPAKSPPLRVQELVLAARNYLDQPAGETQAARQIRQKKILDGLTGRELTVRAALYDVKPTKKTGEFRAEFWSKNGPSETIVLRFVSTDDSLVALAVGKEKTIRLKITGLSFGVTYKGARAAPWPIGEGIGAFQQSAGRAENATGTAFIVEGTDAQLAR